VDKFIGDSIMAVFDAEFCGGQHRLCAVTAAVQMLQAMPTTNREIAALGIEPISVGIGMACGRVIRGNVGSESRRELTVIGETVNIASRLESMTKEVGHPIVITLDSFDEHCGNLAGVLVESRLTAQVRGRAAAVEVLALSVAQV